MRKLIHSFTSITIFCLAIAQHSFLVAAPIPKPPNLNVESYIIMDFSS